MLLLITTVSLIGGCATRPKEANVVYVPQSQNSLNPATALVFDPPITAYAPPMNLSRADRAPAAYVGFDSVTTTVYTRMDDRQFYSGQVGQYGFLGAFRGHVERQSVVQTVGVRQK